jgi:hypothetical protein
MPNRYIGPGFFIAKIMEKSNESSYTERNKERTG